MLKQPTLLQLLYLTQRITAGERAEFEALAFGSYDAEEHASRMWRKRGPAHVFLDDAGLPYYAAGFEIGSPGVATAWSVSTDACASHVLEMTRVSRRVIGALLKDNVHRIQMSCLASRVTARRWYEALGADHEATFDHLGRNGENFVMYAVTREGL